MIIVVLHHLNLHLKRFQSFFVFHLSLSLSLCRADEQVLLVKQCSSSSFRPSLARSLLSSLSLPGTDWWPVSASWPHTHTHTHSADRVHMCAPPCPATLHHAPHPSIHPSTHSIYQLLVACTAFSLLIALEMLQWFAIYQGQCMPRYQLDRMTHVIQTAVLVNKAEFEWALMKRQERVC